jgi:hypothetical protein
VVVHKCYQLLNFNIITHILDTQWRSWLRHCTTSRIGRRFDSQWCHWNLSLTQPFRPHYGPGIDSASSRNEYQEYFLGVTVAAKYGWLPYNLHVPTVLKSGILDLLETSGPVQVCDWFALPFITSISDTVKVIKRLLHYSFFSLFIDTCRTRFGTKLQISSTAELGRTVNLPYAKRQHHMTRLAWHN